MIITSMEQFGKAVDDGKSFQISSVGGSEWKRLDFFELELCKVISLITEGRLRIKPSVTYYRVYTTNGNPEIAHADKPFSDFEDWINNSLVLGDEYLHIHDFYREE